MQPKFPQGFVQESCYKVMEARSWRRNFGLPPDPQDDAAYADCAMNRAGFGFKCENCDRFVSPEHKHYKDLDKFDKDIRQWEKEQEEVEINKGAYI